MPKYEITTADGKTTVIEAANAAAAHAYADNRLPREVAPIHTAPGEKIEAPVLITPREQARVAGRESSTAGATVAGAHQGITRNFGDEVTAAGEASGMPGGVGTLIPGYGLLRAGVGAGRMLLGDEGASKTYDRELEQLRGRYEGMQEAHPIATTGGELVGGMVGPMPAGKVAAVAVNAADAALSGAGAGEDAQSRGVGAGTGAAVGGTLSAAIPYGLNKLARIYRGVMGNLGGAGAERIATQEAEQQAAAAFQRDLNRLTPAQRAERAAQNQFADQTGQSSEKVIADYGGENVRDLFRSSTNQSSDARAAAKEVLDERYAGQSQRVSDVLDQRSGAANTHQRQQALEAQARRENHPRYQAAYNSPHAQAVWTPELETLTTSDAVRKAIRDTTRTSSDYAALAGQRQAPRNPFTEAADGTLQLPQGQAPDLPFWDHVQRNLRSQEGRARAAGDGEEASRIGSLRRQLNEHLDTAVPEFRTARAGAAAHFGAEDALEAGSNFLKGPNINKDETKAAIARFSPAERQLFEHGVEADLRTAVRAVTDGRDVAKLMQSPELRERLVLGLGPSRAAEVQGTLRVERGMNDLKSALGNSTTAQQLIQAGVFGTAALGGGALGAGADYATGGYGGGSYSASSLGALAGLGLRHGNAQLNKQVATRVGQLLMSREPADVQRLGVAMRNPQIKLAVESFFDRVAAVAGQEAGRLQAEQARGAQ